jgi:Uncharacterized protein containing LysM domain
VSKLLQSSRLLFTSAESTIEFAKYLDAGQRYYRRADGTIWPEIKPGKYVLQAGDTMTDISIRRFGTPKRWREIYERNKKLCDTEWHPGATLTIP